MGVERRRLQFVFVIIAPIAHLSARCALQEVIPTRPRVSNDTFVRSISSEDDPIGAWAATRVHILACQDREFIVWSRIRECDTLVVFVRVRILASANCLAVLVVPVALLNGSLYVRLDVAC